MLPPSEKGVNYYYSRGDDFANEVIVDPSKRLRGQFNTTEPFLAASYDCRTMSKSPFEVKPRELNTLISA